MEKIAFRIKGMCCGEEIAALKREVGPLVGGELNLSFDLLEKKMTIMAPPAGISETRVRNAVSATGMEAIPWDAECSAGVCAVEEGAWQRHGRLVMCAASGVLMLLGVVVNVIYHGSILQALAVGGREEYTPTGAALLFFAAIIAGAWYTLPRAFFAARRFRPDMNLLMVLAVIGAASIGQWLEAASVAFLFALALLLESWSVGRARRAIKALVDISPSVARYICPADGDVEEKPVGEVPVNVTVLVRPGEKIPLDGVVTKGFTTVNQAPITGESIPVSKQVGDDVFAGTINGEGSIEFRSTKPSTDTTLARIIHMVEEAQSRRAAAEQWVEKFARFYTPAMMAIAAAIAVVPPAFLGGSWEKWFYEALVILVIACPCSLVISTPVSIVAGLTSAARSGVLIKGGAYLEAPAHLKAIAFDKTGTLTIGHPTVRQVIPMDDHTQERLMARAAALESHSTHPMARAILNYAKAQKIQFAPADDFTIIPGQGAQGTIDGRAYWVGSHRLLSRGEGRADDGFREAALRLENGGHSQVVMWCDDHVCGLIGISDEVRGEARNAIHSLRKLGIDRIAMITGDNVKTAQSVASATGVDDLHADLLPEGKVSVVRELRERFENVAVVGDGVNDAPAMAEASLGIAMGAMGSDAAIETADVALMSDDLSKVPWLIRHSRRTLGIIKQNIFFSLGIKVLFITLALGGIATLWGAIAADMGASLLVIFNSLRLLHTKYGTQYSEA